ncbi:hypothetical protein Q3G72_019104 [Acer saccharum]|nr:hypothetical protein Q3G72_019104 [Acer saccharum]
MEKDKFDYVLIPSGLFVLALYHVWLLYNIIRNPRQTVIGLNAESRHQWVFSIMTDPLKNGTLAVQTIRNNMMASTLLGTTAIALCSLISVFVSSTTSSNNTASEFVDDNNNPILSSVNLTQQLYNRSFKEEMKDDDLESIIQSTETIRFEDSHLKSPLLTSINQP